MHEVILCVMCCFIPPGVPNIWCAFNSLNALPFWCLSTPEYHKLHELRHGSSSSSCLQLWAQSLLSEPQESVEFLHYFSCCFFAGMLKHQKNPFKTYITFSGRRLDTLSAAMTWRLQWLEEILQLSTAPPQRPQNKETSTRTITRTSTRTSTRAN